MPPGGMPQMPDIPPPPDIAPPVTDAAAAGEDAAGALQPGMDPALGGAPSPGAETVTVKDGERTLTMRGQDGEGNVTLTIDDGTGNPKTYALDFDAKPDSPDTGGQPASGVAGGAGGITPGEPAALPGQEAIQHGEPGADGKIVLHDGETTITAERPEGAEGPVKVTIDDGTGEPVSYLLDQQDSAGGAAGADPSAGTPDTASGAANFSADVPSDQPPSPAPSAAGEPVGEPVGATSPQGSSVPTGAGGGGFADAFGSGIPDSGPWSASGDLLGDPDAHLASAPGEAQLAAVPDDGGGGHHAQPSGQSSAMGGGMPMMGGMGAMGGGGQGGDSERNPGMWRTEGNLFDDDSLDAIARISGVLGESS